MLDAGLDRLRSLGVSDVEAVIVPVDEGAEERTLDYLESRSLESRSLESRSLENRSR